ncbi:MAG: tetratricopeptide repeat protein [Bacteroidales bacterium]|nr:tetratricopeptide repeat protein [Bacteroidales bacterium]
MIVLLSSCSVMRDLRKADKHYSYGEYVEAAKIYSKAYRRIDSKEKALRAKVAYNQGECYRISNQTIKAENAYAKAIRYQYPNDTVYLQYALVLHKNAKYKPAIVNYDKFLENHPENVLALKGVFACTQIEQWREEAKDYEVKKSAKLNLKRGNFAPILIPMEYQSLIFSSSATLKEGAKLSKITGLPENDFYLSQLDQYNQWEKPIPIEGAINSEFDEGVGCFDSNGTTLYFTRCVTKSTESGGNSKAAIYRSRRSGEKWSEPELMEVSRDTSFIYAHPALSTMVSICIL